MAKRRSKQEVDQEKETKVLTAEELDSLLKEARLPVRLLPREEYVVRQLSSVMGNMSKKEVAEELGRTTWDIYNIRRNAVRKLAKYMKIWDEEAVFPILSLKRGRKMPIRATRYYQPGVRADEVQLEYQEYTDVSGDESNDNSIP